MGRIRHVVVLLASGLCLAAQAGCARADRETDVVGWYVFREPSGAFAEAARRCSQAAAGRYRIAIRPLPADADQQREQLVRRLAAHDPAIDVIGMDVMWTAEFAEAGWIVPWEGDAATRARDGTLASALATGTYGGRLYAAPFTTNAQLLWYRTDLVREPPATWDAMMDASERLAARGAPHAVAVQGSRYEGLVVWFTSLLASSGGRVVADDGTVALEPGPTRTALAVMARLATSAAAAPGLATAREDDARLAFEAGRAAFMVNYPFVWPSAQRNAPALARHMGWARWPATTARPSRVVLGGLNLGVSAFSRDPRRALEAAACLRRPEQQRLAARDGGLLPTAAALYDDPVVTAAFPFATLLRETLRDAVARPATPAYNDVSLAIQRVLHPPRSIDPVADAARLRRRVDAALHSRGLL